MSANPGATRLDIELTPDLRAKYYTLGGAAWLRDTLEKASVDHVADRPLRALTRAERTNAALDAIAFGTKAAARQHKVSISTIYYLRKLYAQSKRS